MRVLFALLSFAAFAESTRTHSSGNSSHHMGVGSPVTSTATATPVSSCANPIVIVPDGRIAANTISAGTTSYFLISSRVGSAYSAEFHNSVGAAAQPPGTLTVYADGACTAAITPRDTAGIEPGDQNAARISFTATTPQTRIVLSNSSGGPIGYSFSVSDTTMFSPAWSDNGDFDTFYSFQNTTGSSLNGILTLLDTGGAVVTTFNLTIAATQTASTNTAALGIARNQTGTARFIHDGPPAAVLAEAAIARFSISPAYVQPVRFEAMREARQVLRFGSHGSPSCFDNDGDGWTTCDGDCCDAAGLCPGADPAGVNPGAFEVAGNAVDDDCDATTPDTGLVACDGGLASNSSEPTDYARAIDLCSFTTEAPPLAQKKWGVISAGFFQADGAGTPAANSRSIRSSFGSNVGPQAGNAIAVLSTGNAAAPSQTNPAWINPQVTGVDTGATSGLPADWLAANGGTVPVTPGCPEGGTTANDPILLKLRVRAPTNARSFRLRAFFYSSEYPEYVCSPFIDYFLALLDSQFVPGAGQSANPADKNLAVYDPPPAGAPFYPVNGNLAFGDTGLFTQCKNGPIGCAPTAVESTISTCTGTGQLTGTGFDILNPAPKFMGDPGYCGVNNLLGGGTGWLTVRGNVKPGETVELRFVVWDTSDPWYDSVVLLDDFQWSVTPATPGTTP